MRKSLPRPLTAAVASAAVLLPVLALAACGSRPALSLPAAGTTPARHSASAARHSAASGQHRASATQTATTTVSTPAGIGRCLRSQLVAWVGIPRTGFTNESDIYDLEISNISSRACTLYGYPGVSAISPDGSQLGSSAGRAGGLEFLVTLGSGGTAHAIVYIAHKGDFTASMCKPVVAYGLSVYAPGGFSPLAFPFSFPACARRGPVYLSVSPVAAGVGIPGFGN